MEIIDKEVYFDQWCPKCTHKNAPEDEDPCNECLCYTANEYSHKPVKFEEESK